MTKSDGLSLHKTRLTAGVWEGELHQPDLEAETPEISVTHRDHPVRSFTLEEAEGRPGVFLFRFAIPADLINDGVETFVFSDAKTGTTLNTCALIAGEPLAEDIRAEMDLMRDELDMLKRAFRRHCIDTGAA